MTEALSSYEPFEVSRLREIGAATGHGAEVAMLLEALGWPGYGPCHEVTMLLGGRWSVSVAATFAGTLTVRSGDRVVHRAEGAGGTPDEVKLRWLETGPTVVTVEGAHVACLSVTKEPA